MRAATERSIALSSRAMITTVRAPRASRPATAAPPNMPAPWPATFPFSVSSAFASSISLRTSVVVCSESCLTSSPVECDRSSFASPFAVLMAS
jgi:hypothetical protein